MNFENAVLLKRQRIYWLQCEMHGGARGVSSLDFLRRGSERRVDARVVDQQGEPAFGSAINSAERFWISASDTVAALPDLQVTFTRSAALLAAMKLSANTITQPGVVPDGSSSARLFDILASLRRRIVNRNHFGVVTRRRNFRARINHPFNYRIQPVFAFADDL